MGEDQVKLKSKSSEAEQDEEVQSRDVIENYKSRTSTILGVVQIVVAVFSLVYNVACFFKWRPFFSAFWPGVWCFVMVSKHEC